MAGVRRSSAVLLVLFSVACLPSALSQDEDGSSELYRIEGKVFPPDAHLNSPTWQANARILVNGGEYLGFLKEDGSFAVNNVPSGTYVVEVSSPNHAYEAARVDINSKGKFRARKVNHVQTSQVIQLPYPLKMKPMGMYRYFQVREVWRITDVLFNPMVIFMLLPFVLIMILPKMLNDPETRKEMEQFQMPKYDMPEMSEMLTSLFAGGETKPKSNKAVKPAKRRQ